MTKQKDLKRVVRSRMVKTGESYTTARVHVLNKNVAESATAIPAPAPAPPPPPDYAALAGMSDASVKKATGCDWEKWVGALDYAGAMNWSHGEIAKYVQEKFNVSGWWSQSVTVGYERIRGVREIGQTVAGSYDANKSKTFPVPVDSLFAAFHDARIRRRWLPGVKLTIRTATPAKSMRILWDDSTAVDVYFSSSGETKSKVAIQHRKLKSRPDAERTKTFWTERLAALDAVLTRPKG